MENRIVPREGFRLETLKISNYQRKLHPAAPSAHNVDDGGCIMSRSRCARHIGHPHARSGPDVVVGTGGYASFPALRRWAARLSHSDGMVHESNAVPGLTTRMVEKIRGRGLWSRFRRAAGLLITTPTSVVVTGTPVREELPLYDPRGRPRAERSALGDEPLDRLLLGEPRRAGDEQEDRGAS